MATDTKVTVLPVSPMGGAANAGWKLGVIDSVAKAAANDTLTVGNADSVEWGFFTIDSDGSEESITISGKTITLTDSTTGSGLVSGIIVYK